MESGQESELAATRVVVMASRIKIFRAALPLDRTKVQIKSVAVLGLERKTRMQQILLWLARQDQACMQCWHAALLQERSRTNQSPEQLSIHWMMLLDFPWA